MIETEGNIKKLEFQRDNNSPTVELDTQAVSHILLGQDCSERLTEGEMNRLRQCMEGVLNDRIDSYKQVLQQLHQQAQAILR